ncbi:uncharacterized protein [Rutidosis leptorrhynchoides]|uniref:uncharacterized protein n=1 Tax=Rutidosis leptorrhynchoides TaxID=125765 RepID=UPI003A98D2FC
MRFWINNPYDANAVYKPYRYGFKDNVDDMDEANPKIQDLGELVDVYELKNEVQEDEVNDHETIVEVKKRKISECETSNIEEVIKRVVLSNEVEDCAQSKVELIESSQLSDEDAYKFTNDDISQSQPKKKLLILDIYGILVDIVDGKDATIGRDYSIGSKSAVYKRPYCDDFLDFCFKNFFVCVWSSTTRWEMEKVLNVISKDLIERFAFCLDQTDCINTGEKTPENMSKPLFLKDVRKLWLLYDAANPFDEDFYNVTNTILLDNSPYKALCNPPYTAIFPITYDYRNREDNCLGPDGNIRKYLEKLAACDNVQNYIKKNPFGQEPISEKNKFWNFYLQIKRKIASRRNKLLLDYINNNKTQSHMLGSWDVENASSIIE